MAFRLFASCCLAAIVVAVLARPDTGALFGRASARAGETPPQLQDALGPLAVPMVRLDLAQPAKVRLRLADPPHAGLAFDLGNGTMLWRRGATRQRPIASLTKLMTALLAVEHLQPGDLVRVPRAADRIGGSHMGGLMPGRHVRAEVLLEGLLIASGNDAAVTLAIASDGSEKAFVRDMNRRARDLGLSCTHYVDPDGLDIRDHSCPADLAALAVRAMAQPRIAAIARHSAARVWPGSGRMLTLRTTNPLLRAHYPGAIGLKTGFTDPAGRCLVAVVQRGGRRIAVVLLGDDDPGANAERIVHAVLPADM
jgi:D-alanyl-D-alanine carboxypeptidase (penicillin-binding protein 5/6)